MSSRPRSFVALALCSPLALVACNDPPPPTPAEVRSQITNDLGHVLRETAGALTGGQDALPASDALAMFGRVLGTTTTATSALAIGAPNIDADAEVAYLNDKLFTDANAVGDGVFRVPAELLCTRTQADGTSAVDATCVQQVAKIQPQIRTSKDGDALVLALELDAAHDEPLQVTLSHTSLAVSLDFDAAQRATAAIAGALGNELPNLSLAGAITGRLDILGSAQVQASLAIDRKLAIAAAPAGQPLTGDAALVLSSAPGEVVALTLDGKAKTGALTTGIGETTLALPMIDGKRIALDLAGFATAATFAANQPLALKHLGLGDHASKLTVNGATATTIDLNPDDGRAVDITLTRDDAAATTTIAVAPRLDLRIARDHGVLGDAKPVYDVTRVQLDGSVRSHEASDAFEVLSGSFAITTDPASFGFNARPGQCVTDVDASDASGAHFTQWSVAACP